VEYRCEHCHADGALHPSTPDDPEVVRRSDDERMLLFTAKEPAAREGRRDRRALVERGHGGHGAQSCSVEVKQRIFISINIGSGNVSNLH
jgi:hypothetical protein